MNSTEKLPIEFRIAQLEANLENELRLSGASEDRISAAESTILREKAAIAHSNKTIAASIERSKQIEAALEVLRMKQADEAHPISVPQISEATHAALVRVVQQAKTTPAVAVDAYSVHQVRTMQSLAEHGESLLHPLLREAREILLEARHTATSETRQAAADIIIDLARASLLEALASDSGFVDGVPVPMTIAVVDGAVYDLGLIDGLD